MTDEQIIEMADSMVWDTHEGISDEDLIAFARLIAAKQKAIDVGICFNTAASFGLCGAHFDIANRLMAAIGSQK